MASWNVTGVALLKSVEKLKPGDAKRAEALTRAGEAFKFVARSPGKYQAKAKQWLAKFKEDNVR